MENLGRPFLRDCLQGTGMTSLEAEACASVIEGATAEEAFRLAHRWNEALQRARKRCAVVEEEFQVFFLLDRKHTGETIGALVARAVAAIIAANSVTKEEAATIVAEFLSAPRRKKDSLLRAKESALQEAWNRKASIGWILTYIPC